MKIITELSVTSIEGEAREPRGILNIAHVEPVPGIHVKVALGSAGVIVRRGDAAVCYPLAVLIAAADQHQPGILRAAAPAPKVAEIAHEKDPR